MTSIRRVEMTEDMLELLRQDGDLHAADPIPWDVHDTWAAFDGPTPVAIATGRPDRSDPTAYFLSTCFVHPTARGAGIQKRLIRARCRHARRSGFLAAWTYTAVFSVASMRSLISCGFRPTSARRVPGFLCWEKPICSTT